jgi:hypothetical protein
MKIIINKCYGGYGLSHAAVMEWAKRKKMKLYPFTEIRDAQGNLDFHHFKPYKPKKGEDRWTIHYTKKPLKKDGTYDDGAYFYPRDEIPRTDPILIKIVREMGRKKAGGRFSELQIVDVPDGVSYEIEEYDGMEWVAETHRTWG